MSITINTNVMSLNAQRNLGQSRVTLERSMYRLSSGLRINSAKDDAAGLGISNRMTSQIRGLNQAARNANDAISLAQTAEGALQESSNILQRIRELAVQSANDSNNTSDRASLNDEVSQLKLELNRIAETTIFNGRKLIDGSFQNAHFHVGSNSGAKQSISFSIQSARTEDLSYVSSAITAPGDDGLLGESVTGAGPLAAGSIVVNGTAIETTSSGSNTDIVTALNTAAGSTIAEAVNEQTFNFSNITLAGTTTLDSTSTVGSAGTLHSAGSPNVTASMSGVMGGITVESTLSGAAGNFTVEYIDTHNSVTVGASWDSGSRTLTLNSNWDGSMISTTGGLMAGLDLLTGDLNFTLNNNVTVSSPFGTIGSSSTVNGSDTPVPGDADVNLSAADISTINKVDVSVGGTALNMSNSDFDAVSDMTGLVNALNSAATSQGLGLTASDAGGGVLNFSTTGTSGALAINSSTDGTFQEETYVANITGDYTINLGGSDIVFDATHNGGGDGVVSASDLVDAVQASPAYTASLNEDGTVTIGVVNGSTMTVAEDNSAGGSGDGFTDGEIANPIHGQIRLIGENDISLSGPGLAAAGLDSLGGSGTTTIDKVDVGTRENAGVAIGSVDAAFSNIASMRGNLGSLQNRFESTIANLNNVAENLSAARSRILDADIAMESSAMTKNNILQQAGVSVLAQANETPTLALSLF